MILKKYKSKLIFTLCFIGFSILSLFTNLVRSNKIKWEKPNKITFQDSINYNVYTTSENGFFYNLKNNSQVLQTWKLYLNVIYQDVEREQNIVFDTFTYDSDYFNNFDIFSNDYNSFSLDKITYYFQDYLNVYILNNSLDAFYSYEQIDIYFYCDAINFDYQLENTLIVNTETYISSNHYDTQDAPVLRLGVVNFDNNTKNVSSLNYTFDSSNLEFTLNTPNSNIYSFSFRIMSDINNDYANYYFNFSNVISSLYDEIDLLNNQINNLLSRINDLNNVNVSLNEDNLFLQSQLNDLQSYVSDLQAEILSGQIREDYYVNEINNLHNQINTLNSLLNSARNSEWNFNRLMFNIASTPLESFKTFYNVEFWGINLSDLFLGILFSGLIFYLFRRFIGSFFSL